MSNLYKALTAFIVVLLIGSAGLFIMYRRLANDKAAQEEAARSLKRPDISVTIVEGKRREEIADLLETKGVCTVADFLAYTTEKEGYLFPDTYRFFPNTPAKEVVDTLVSNFYLKTGSLRPSNEDLTLASIVEREAQNDEERASIAGVYANRLSINMRLEADPTVQYGKDTNNYIASGNSSYKFWGPITREDYTAVYSQYNTYANNGLPPHPIANPGKASILAALNPEEHDYLYFLHKNGKLLLSKTLAEHLRNQ